MPSQSTPRHIGILRHSLFLRSEQFIWGQARHLDATVTYLARDRITDPPSGARVSEFATSRATAAMYTAGWDASLRNVAKSSGITHLHAHFGVEGEASRHAARKLGIPHLTTLHGFDVSLSRGALVRSGKPAWIRYGSRRARFFRSPGTQFICVSEHVRRLAERIGLDPGRSIVIPTGVDVVALRPQPLRDTGVIVHVARLVEKKGTAYLLDAMSEIIRREPEAQLKIIGDGPLRGRLKAQSEASGLKGHVSFLGPMSHDDVVSEIAAADVLCLPSVTAESGDQEGLGQVVLEAGALGRPVVATDHGGLREAVQHERTGLLVPERDPRMLADALCQLIANPTLAAQYGGFGAAFVSENYSVQRGAARLDALYSDLTGVGG